MPKVERVYCDMAGGSDGSSNFYLFYGDLINKRTPFTKIDSKDEIGTICRNHLGLEPVNIESLSIYKNVVRYLNQIGAVTRLVQGVPLMHRIQSDGENLADDWASFGKDKSQYTPIKEFIETEDMDKLEKSELLMLSLNRIKLSPSMFLRENIIGVVC